MNRKKAVTKIDLRNLPWQKIFLGLTLAAVILGAFFSTKTLSKVFKNIEDTKEAARPANIKITKIIAPDCQDCFNMEAAVSNLKKQNVKVEEETTITFDSPEAGEFIKQLAIKKVPTYLVTGEVSKGIIENFVKKFGEVKEDTFIFTKLSPVFIDTSTGQEAGRVTATLITDPSCAGCIDPKTVVESFKKAGVNIKEEKEFTWNSAAGQNVINQYKLTRVPTFIFSSEFDLYEKVKSAWQNFGTVEADKTYVARNVPVPFRDVVKGQISGLVDLIFLTDSSCPECYRASDVQKPILTRGYGVVLNSERTVDILSGEGQTMIGKYKITKAPTVLISPEADQYTGLKNAWKNVGTIEEDGWFIFREMQQLRGAVYKDLTTGKIVGKVALPSPGPSGAKE